MLKIILIIAGTMTVLFGVTIVWVIRKIKESEK